MWNGGINTLTSFSNCILTDPLTDNPLGDAVQEYIWKILVDAAVGVRTKSLGVNHVAAVATEYGLSDSYVESSDPNATVACEFGRMLCMLDGFDDTITLHFSHAIPVANNHYNAKDIDFNVLWTATWVAKPPVPPPFRGTGASQHNLVVRPQLPIKAGPRGRKLHK